ncbi:MAG: hypothetical protein N3E47_07900, partial [Candidatus Bathyarchaeota archaeon]|nr:hypothetical protein [Candidatus Bathyarchaeota archaeon]
GGDRPKMSMAQRMYWKARNHTVFLHKHINSSGKRLWYMGLSIIILMLYRPNYMRQIIKGVKEGCALIRKLGRYS